MGNVMCQCLINESKDKQGGNISIEDLKQDINKNNENLDKLKINENTLTDQKEEFNQKTGQKILLKKYKQEQNLIHNIDYNTNTGSKKNEKVNHIIKKNSFKIKS